MKTIYMIDTEYGTIALSKKEYEYTKERVTNEHCPDDEIEIAGSLKQYSYWHEEIEENDAAQERVIIGYKQIVKYGTIEEPEVLSEFEQNLVNNKDNLREVLKIVEEFLKSH